MAISDNLIEDAIRIIATIKDIEINQQELVDDVILVALVFDEESAFKSAIAQIVHSLKLIVRTRTIGQELVNNYEGWRSFHFQSSRVSGHRADLRIVFIHAIRVRGFGHRHLPQDVYTRLNNRRR